MRIAIVHDYLNQYGGAERCLEVFHALFPESAIFTLIYDEKVLPQYRGWDIRTSFVQNIPFSRSAYRNFMFIFPFAVRSFNLKGYDLVISITHAWGKGIKPDKGSCHICFCLTPVRYFWDLYEEYRSFRSFNWFQKLMLSLFAAPIRRWDKRASRGVHHFIAISNIVADRITRFYRRDSTVIYPPVNTDFFKPAADAAGAGYYLTVSRLKEYKRIDVIVEAFNSLNLPLKVVGTGELLAALKKTAKDNVEFIGTVTDTQLLRLYQGCKALIFAANEDFGMVPLEVQACGRPVIAFAKGGALETVIEGMTGTFFNEQTPDSLISAVLRFQDMKFDPEKIRQNAEKFKRSIFEAKIKTFIEKKYREFRNDKNL